MAGGEGGREWRILALAEDGFTGSACSSVAVFPLLVKVMKAHLWCS